MLTERPSMEGFNWLLVARVFFPLISSTARSLTSGATKTHLLRCGTIDWPGFPEIGGELMRAT